MISIGDRNRETEYILSGLDEAPVLLHPSMALQYQQEISRLIETLNDEKFRSVAAELMRTLISKVVLTPNSAKTELTIDLFGDLAGVLAMARKGGKPLDTSDIETLGLKLVAEEGLEPPARGL
jgi:site-specific DNA recombinase